MATAGVSEVANGGLLQASRIIPRSWGLSRFHVAGGTRNREVGGVEDIDFAPAQGRRGAPTLDWGRAPRRGRALGAVRFESVRGFVLIPD
jgi:hypothetical protein